jgi:ABC-type dipeptide/oligopeptide/nickel transport system permease component
LRTFLLRRLLSLIPLPWVTLLAFLLIYLRPATSCRRWPRTRPSGRTIEAMRHVRADQPWFVQYFLWLRTSSSTSTSANPSRQPVFG